MANFNRIRVRDPKKIEMEMTLVMTIGEWQDLNEDLANVWPASKLKLEIESMIGKVTQAFFSDVEETKP